MESQLMLSREEIKERLAEIFDPEPDEDGLIPVMYPHKRLRQRFGLDTSYVKKSAFDYEGSSTHEDTRLIDPSDQAIPGVLFSNLNLADQLFDAAFRLFGDSLLAYCEGDEISIFRYYPPAIMTLWSGFEAQGRFLSELLLITVPDIPEPVKAQLLEYELALDHRSEVVRRDRSYPILDRYRTLLRYGYSYQADRGSPYWQRGDKARRLRNYLVHVDVRESRGITADEVLNFMEDVLMLFITPSCMIGKSIFLGQFRFHNIVTDLRELVFPHTEQPFFGDRKFREKFLLHCNFNGVDATRFPNTHQLSNTETKQ